MWSAVAWLAVGVPMRSAHLGDWDLWPVVGVAFASYLVFRTLGVRFRPLALGATVVLGLALSLATRELGVPAGLVGALGAWAIAHRIARRRREPGRDPV